MPYVQKCLGTFLLGENIFVHTALDGTCIAPHRHSTAVSLHAMPYWLLAQATNAVHTIKAQIRITSCICDKQTPERRWRWHIRVRPCAPNVVRMRCGQRPYKFAG